MTIENINCDSSIIQVHQCHVSVLLTLIMWRYSPVRVKTMYHPCSSR